MNVRRNWFFFLVMLMLSACVILLLAEKPILEDWNLLHGVSEGDTWQTIGTGSGKVAAAAGWRDGLLAIRYFTTDEKLLSEQKVTLPEELSGGTIARILPIREGFAYLGLYGPNAEKLYLYRINGKETERLLSCSCVGETFQERTSRTMLSEFLHEDGVVSFAVCEDGILKCYRCRETGGLEASGTGSCAAGTALSILSTEEGVLLTGGNGFLTLGEKTAGTVVSGKSITHLTQGRGGWYFLDAAQLDVCFVDAAFGSSYRVFRLFAEWDGELRNLTSAALTRDESALTLLDGRILTVTDSEGTRELTGILYPTAMRAGLSLAKYAAFALLAAGLLWLLLCGLRRGYAPLVVFRGGMLITAALICFTALRFGWLMPVQRSAALRENNAVVSSALRAARAGSRMNDMRLTSDVCQILEGEEEGSGRNVRTLLLRKTGGKWKTNDGRLALTLDGFSPVLAESAQQNGWAEELQDGCYQYVFAMGDRCLSISIEDPYEPEVNNLYYPLLAGFAVLTGLALLILLSVGFDVRRISKKMEYISRGGVPERLNLRTGDELESMASIVNSLGVSMQRQEQEREYVEDSYRRFVPEKVLALLGKKTIQEVDKSAFAARRMAVMTVWFSFPDTLYTDINNSRLLFDSVNEVIERTASIVSRKGGSVFHFAYSGYDVVMDEDGEAVSTAVAIQQEVLSFNELRTQQGLPCVTLRIALDKGNVMLGIVGDANKMEPTTISTSLSTVQELIDLCNRLKAGILCTEAIISESQEYGNRYMGKCIVGDQPVRVYEVFDGDEFNVRRGKSSSLNEFSQGVYDLYGGDAASAKHMFLQLAHVYPYDGGARYYLYLADRLEHDPTLPCVLNVDNAAEGEI